MRLPIPSDPLGPGAGPTASLRSARLHLEALDVQRVHVALAAGRLELVTEFRVKEEAGPGLKRILELAGASTGEAGFAAGAEKTLRVRQCVSLPAEVLEMLARRPPSPDEAASWLERGGGVTWLLELCARGKVGEVAYEAWKPIPVEALWPETLTEQIDQGDRSWNWSAAVEAGFVEYRGSFTGFCVALAHHLARNDRDANRLLALRPARR